MTQPKLAMGCWAWGDTDNYFGNKMTGAEFKPIFDAAMKNGLNLFDTATAYGGGNSEKILGSFIETVPRESVIVSTKFTPQMAAMYDNSVEKMCKASLERMKLSFIDIYWIHNTVGFPAWTEQLIPLLKAGLVKRVGVSNHNLAEVKQADEILKKAGFRVSAVQNHYSLLNRSSEESGLLDYCLKNNISFFSYMVLEQGALAGKYDAAHPFPAGSARAASYNPKLKQIESITKKMKEIGAKHGLSCAQVGTAWAIGKGTLPIVGVTSVAQVEDAAKAAAVALSKEEIAELDAVGAAAGVSTIREWEKKMD